MLYSPVLSLQPFEEDNVYVLAWSASTPAARVLAVDPSYYPEWRPLAYSTIWIEQHLGAPIPLHFAVNLALWIACAWLVYRITHRLSHSAVGAIMAAVLIVTDPRATWTLVAIVERQTSLACLFGLLAILIAISRETRLAAARQVLIAALLVASTLSKEYGAAFTLALVAFGVMERRRDLWQPAVVAAVIYLAARKIVVGAMVQPYCEEMYFLGTAHDVCLDLADPASFAQLSYNAAATLVNLPLLGLLSGAGAPIFAESRVLTGLLFSGLAVIAVLKGPRATRMLALVALFNAVVSVMIYRERNQLAGACALATLAGIGLGPALEMLTARRLRIAFITAAAALILMQAALARSLVEERRTIAAQLDPCALEIMDRPFVPPYVASLKKSYGLRNPECRAHP